MRKILFIGLILLFSANNIFAQKESFRNDVVIMSVENVTDSDKEDLTDGDIKDVFHVVEQMPAFPGGDKALLDYIKANIQYPESAIESALEGRVVVRFIVRKDGTLSNLKIVKSLQEDCDKEALRIVKKMPQWIPGKQRGKEVDVYYAIPVLFRLNQ